MGSVEHAASLTLLQSQDTGVDADRQVHQRRETRYEYLRVLGNAMDERLSAAGVARVAGSSKEGAFCHYYCRLLYLRSGIGHGPGGHLHSRERLIQTLKANNGMPNSGSMATRAVTREGLNPNSPWI